MPSPPTRGTTNQALFSHYRDTGLWCEAWTACSRITHCVNHALHFRLRELNAAGTEHLLLALLARSLATALPCPALFSSPPPVPVPCGTPVVHAGRCRTDRGTLPTLPCCPPVTRGPLPSHPQNQSPQTGRPTELTAAIGGGAASASALSLIKDNNVLPSSVSALVACHNRQVKTPPPCPRGELCWRPGNLANGIRSPPARWEDGTTLIPL